ncbi:MAG: hypothetical protein HP497_03600 [Nitrospira sp.]|nr:hypothetical protein [Nitrospira sp.]
MAEIVVQFREKNKKGAKKEAGRSCQRTFGQPVSIQGLSPLCRRPYEFTK